MQRAQAPAVLLLDTNIAVLSWRYRIGDEGFDLLGELRRLANSGQQRLALDLLSLDELFGIARISGAPRFVLAPTTFDELCRSEADNAASVYQWASELASYQGVTDEWPFDAVSAPIAELLAPEIVRADARLLAEVSRLRADALLTCDYRLIRRRDAGRRIGVHALTPFEVEDWMLGCRSAPSEHVRPCRARMARVSLLTEGRRGLRLGDAGILAENPPVRVAQ